MTKTEGPKQEPKPSVTGSSTALPNSTKPKTECVDSSETSLRTDAEESSLETSLTNEQNASGASFRKGKWMVQEEEYTSRIIYYYNLGLLTLPEGQTLRSYIAKKLNCDPMRITKKFTGACCIGKRVFSTCNKNSITKAEIEAAEKDLEQLEARFRQALETENDGYRSSDIMKRTAMLAETSWLMNQQLFSSGIYGMPLQMGGIGTLGVNPYTLPAANGSAFGFYPAAVTGTSTAATTTSTTTNGAIIGASALSQQGQSSGGYQIPQFNSSQLQQIQQQQAAATALAGVPPVPSYMQQMSNSASVVQRSIGEDGKKKTTTTELKPVAELKKIMVKPEVAKPAEVVIKPSTIFNFNSPKVQTAPLMGQMSYGFFNANNMNGGGMLQMTTGTGGGSNDASKNSFGNFDKVENNILGAKRELSLSLGCTDELLANFSIDSSLDINWDTPTVLNSSGQFFVFSDSADAMCSGENAPKRARIGVTM